MKFVEVKLTFREKLKLLFFGLIAEDKLPVKEVVKEVHIEKQFHVPQPTTTSSPTTKEDINNKEEKLNIPFFDLGDEDVKSNF